VQRSSASHIPITSRRQCFRDQRRSTPASYVVASSFGEKAQWFRNIKADPRVRIYTGSRAPIPATARIVTQQEADRALGAYAKRHPRAWQRFKPVLERTLGSPITEADTPLPIVELRLG
jgi:deazaflavin-dependent oxidoreductase (nitroreductase family)